MKDTIRLILNQFVNEIQISEQRIKWDLDMVLNIASKYSKMNDFKKNEPKAYSQSKRKGDDFCVGGLILGTSLTPIVRIKIVMMAGMEEKKKTCLKVIPGISKRRVATNGPITAPA